MYHETKLKKILLVSVMVLISLVLPFSVLLLL